MPPKAYIFSKEKEWQLIDEVEKRPVLWDAKSDIYRRADLKPLAWEEIASVLGEPFTAELIAKRFKNIKENFGKNFAKVRASKLKSSGSGYDDCFKPTWYLYERLRFLEKSCSQSSSESNLPVSTSSSQSLPPFSPLNAEASQNSSMVDIYFDDTLQRFQVIPPEEEGMSTENQVEAHSAASSSASDFDFLSNPSSPMGPPRPRSVPIEASSAKRAHVGEEFFNKRGSSKKMQTNKVLEKAVSVMTEIANQPAPIINMETKPWDGICAFIGSRLSLMTEETRKHCENELLQVLLKY